ncbi:MAG: hypothetical protein E7573_06300 [Ruminococcaceae bacterium]|nr:hypothetical protein [Oscillospiraceae bacterium]MBR3597231.1 MFS transporter [Clostridia bacterium]
MARQETAVKQSLLDTDSFSERRFVGKKETVAYVLNDASYSLNINDFKERYIYDVVKIDFNFLAFQNLVTTIWDTINDTFIGVVVEKTRTRWGKFRPYLLLGEFPLTIFGLWYWLIPFIFPDTSESYLPKLIMYFAMSIITETAGTFTAIAKSGFLSTITPSPMERSRLIAMANVVTHIFEDIPKQVFGILFDLVNSKKLNIKLPYLFSTFGTACALVSAFLAVYFFWTSTERVPQTISKPKVKHSLKAIINNKPMLICIISDFLGGFNIGASRTNFYVDVIGSITWKTIVGIPAFPIKFISYSFVKPLRNRFSTKALWILEDAWTDMLWLTVFGIGSINNNFQKKHIILPLMGIEEIFEMCVYGLRRVIPAEINNEAMDYCEWKNGYRSEAMIGVTRSIISKLQQAVMGSITNIVMGKIGYVQGKEIGTQTDFTKWWIFALGTGVPIITSALGIIPKFFYPLSASKRKQMYSELYERRSKKAELVKNATAEEMAEIAASEFRGK